jgi:hypothetical protein
MNRITLLVASIAAVTLGCTSGVTVLDRADGQRNVDSGVIDSHVADSGVFSIDSGTIDAATFDAAFGELSTDQVRLALAPWCAGCHLSGDTGFFASSEAFESLLVRNVRFVRPGQPPSRWRRFATGSCDWTRCERKWVVTLST